MFQDSAPHFERTVQSRIWAISDLQSADPAEARRCLGTAIEELTSMAAEFDAIWYLGDGVAGTDLAAVRRVTETQVDLLGRLGLPVRYVMGNHDLDYAKATGDVTLPLYDTVRDHSDWRTTAAPEEWYFVEEIGDWSVLFLSDHVDPEGNWSVTHGKVHGESERYPHDEREYRRVIERISAATGPTIIAGHNAFPGGNRPAEIQRRCFPLPETVRLHLYGHAHVGDVEHVGKDAYRTTSFVDEHDVPQIDVASLEERRSDTIRSAVLELAADGDCAVHLRDHRDRTWLESHHFYGQY